MSASGRIIFKNKIFSKLTIKTTERRQSISTSNENITKLLVFEFFHGEREVVIVFLFQAYFKHCSCFYIVDFEQVNIGYGKHLFTRISSRFKIAAYEIT